MPAISVLIDTYNHERYIEQALTSVVEQDFPERDYEILVVDDGSTDRTADIVRKFAPRVRLLSKRNGGQASAFNAALGELKGDIVAILDGDDWFAREKLAGVMKAFQKHPEVGGVAHGHYEFHEESGSQVLRKPTSEKVISLETAEMASEALRWWKFLIVGALTVRKTVLERAIPISEKLRFCADGPIAWAAMSQRVFVFEEPLCFYRHHASNLHAAIKKGERERVRSRRRMDELMFEEIERMLMRVGVSRAAMTASLYDVWVSSRRVSLGEFGGSRLETLRTEWRALRTAPPGGRTRWDDYLGFPLGAMRALILSPELFYKSRVWYQQRILRAFRDKFRRWTTKTT